MHFNRRTVDVLKEKLDLFVMPSIVPEPALG